jgi:hypothetical protein
MMYTKAFSLLLLATCVAAQTKTRQGEPVVRRGRKMKKSSSNGSQGGSGNGGGGNGGGGNGGGGNGGGDPGEARGDGIAYANGSTLSGAGVKENHQCKNFNNPFVVAAANYVNDYGESDDGCNSNGECSGGCCRVYNYLICDAGNDYPHVACVCSANTFDHSVGPPVNVTSGRTGVVGTGVVGTGVGQSDTGTVAPDVVDDADRIGTDTSEYPVNVGRNAPAETTVDEEFNASPYTGRGWGKPPSDLSSVPDGLEEGDCKQSSHCLVNGNSKVCCKYLSKECKSIIIGAPHS